MSLTSEQQAAIDQIIAQKSQQYGVEQSLIRAIIEQESNWNINARLWEPSLNTASVGLMQVLVPTAASVLGHAVTEDQLYDPNVNIDVGVHYLSMLQSQYGSQGLQAVISAYNGGRPLVNQAGTYNNQGYVDKVMSYYYMYTNWNPTVAQITASSYSKMTGGPETGSPDSPIGMLLISGAMLLLDAYKIFRKGKT